MEEPTPTPFPLDAELGAPTLTVSPDDEVYEDVAKGLDMAGKILEIASIPAAIVPGLPEALLLVKGGLDFIGSIFGFVAEDDKAKVELSILQNATARVQKCEASIAKQTEDLKMTLRITGASKIVATQSEEALIKLKDTLNKAYSNSLKHFDTISTQLNQVLDNIETMKHDIVKSIDVAVERLEDEDTRLSTQQIVSRLNTVCNFFFAEAKLIVALPLEQRVVKLQQTPGIFDFIKHALYGTDGTGILTKLLDIIIDDNLAIPDSTEDNLGFAVLGLLIFGVNMYAFMLMFQLQQHEVLAQSYYDNGELAKFNKYHLRIGTEFKEFAPGLIDDYSGVIAKVLKILNQVLIKFEIESEQMQPFLNATTGYVNLQKYMRSVSDKFTEQITPPKLDASLFFDFSHIETPSNEWKTGSRVMYAMQLLGADPASSTIVGDWFTGWTLGNMANPAVIVGTDLVNKTRVIFRKIDDGKPQIVAYMSNITMYLFNDVNRDLLDSAYEPNKRLALQNAQRYIEQGINVNVLLEHNRRAIHGAAETNNWELASELIKNGSYINVQTDEGYSPLYIATMKGYYDFAKNLLDHGANASMTTTNATQAFTALHVAALKGHTKLVKLLLNVTSVNVNAPSVEGFTPLHYAATFNREEATSLLLAHNETAVNATSTELKLTPLHLAAIHNSDKVVQMLIDTKKANVSAQAVEGNTPLHFAAVYGNRKVVEILLKNGGRQNATLSDDTTPMHMAAFNGDSDLLEDMLTTKEGEAVVDLANNKSLTPLYLAFQNNNIKAARKLQSHDAKIHKRFGGKTFLHLAAQYGHLTAVKNFLDEGLSVMLLDGSNLPALDYAVKNNFTEIINELLKHSASADYNSEGRPMIHNLVNKTEEIALNILKIFVMHRVDINKVDFDTGNSFFQVVCEKGILSIARYLYENKVDIEHKNNDAKTARDLASAKGHDDIVEFLDRIENSKNKTRTRRDVSEDEQSDGEELDLFSQFELDDLDFYEDTATRNRRDVSKEFDATHVASAAARPSVWINGAIESCVSVLKTVPARLASLMSFTLGNSNAHSSAQQSASISLHSTDLNSSLLLLDVFIRKQTGKRYVDTTVAHSATPLEARVFALALVEKLKMRLDQLAEQSGQEQIELDWFSLYGTVERLMMSEQYDEIERLMHSTARNAFPCEIINKRLLVELVDQVLNQLSTEQTGETSQAGLHLHSGDNCAQSRPQVASQLDAINKQYLN